MSRIFKFIIVCIAIASGIVATVFICLPSLSLNALPSNSSSKSKPICEEVYFYHYSQDRPNNATELKTGEDLPYSINAKLPWKFFIHGFTDNPAGSPWFHTGKAAYFQKGEYNVVFVDWSKPANQSYLVSVKNAMDVGNFFGKFIIHLNEHGVSFKDVHLLGHSLGSHMAGFTGKYCRNNAEKIGRITGLDPAGPFFEFNPLLKVVMEQEDPEVLEEIKSFNPYIFLDENFIVPEPLRLSKDDASFVDIIHTDAKNFGILKSIGHCDFFPNGGLPLQPGCETTEDDYCSHTRSAELFVESINLNNFVARKCASYEEFNEDKCRNNSKAVMGEHTDHSTTGIYYLKTNAQPPFGKADKLNALPSNSSSKSKPVSEEVYFYHYSQDRPNNATELKTGEDLPSSINVKLPWKFFIHGFTDNPAGSPWFHTGKAAYFQKGEYNVVFVDWSKPANQSYLVSVKNAMEVGNFFGKFIIHLNDHGVSFKDVHLLGHSLGSHMAGFTGKYCRNNAEKIGRITGLDPAGPFFEFNPLLKVVMEQEDPEVLEEIKSFNPYIFLDENFIVPEPLRLSKDDASFVDIIHTDAKHLSILTSIGHCDFFPNGGLPLQPGCETTEDDYCSHGRSAELFVESINLNNFVARKCASYEEFNEDKCRNNSKTVMGEHTDHSTTGIYYLKTNAQPPFGKADKLNALPSNSSSKSKPISEEVYFYHYSQDRPNNATELKTGEDLPSSINVKLPWKFFIHGFTDNPAGSPWYHTGKAAYFQKGEYNVVFVDWSKPANQLYLLSEKIAMDAGIFFGKFIIHLNEHGVSFKDVHLLGLSLGSHMAGFAGKYCRNNAEKIGRITGLDPVGPFFEFNPLLKVILEQEDPEVLKEIKSFNPYDENFIVPEPLRLSKDDASFVDIIHTDAKNFGILKSIGHCDFFPNGGLRLQPGCETTEDDYCSHDRSADLFVESINLNNFVARKCASYEEFNEDKCRNNSKTVMGEHTDYSTTGIYYLKTNAQPPFGKGDM